MNLPLLSSLRGVLSLGVVRETRDGLTLTCEGALRGLHSFNDLASSLSLPYSLKVGEDAVLLEELRETDNWQLSIGKDRIIHALGIDKLPDETVVLFLTVEGYEEWADRQASLAQAFSWADRLTIYVDGIGGSISGPALRCGPLDTSLLCFDLESQLTFPDEKAVARQVYIERGVLPRGIGKSILTRGDFALPSFSPLLRWSEWDSSALLMGDVATSDGRLVAVLRGGRRVELIVDRYASAPNWAHLQSLQAAVGWAFSDYSEAQHALLMARLALDAKEGESVFDLLRRELLKALEVARQQFRVTVVERKDQSVKEQRDLLKDVRAQAEVFSSKVRDLVSSFLRDILASMLLIGLGLIARLNSGELTKISDSAAIDAFFKGLAVYFAISLFVQVAAHWRDLWLTSRELKRWWDLSRSQLPGSDVARIIGEVIRPRWVTFFSGVGVLAILNAVMIASLWNWKALLEVLNP